MTIAQGAVLRQVGCEIFCPDVARSVSRLGLRPKRTALQSPWQNGTAERFVGSVRRELVDHVVVLGEDHLRRLLREYVEYDNTERVHTSLDDSPEGRAVQKRPSDQASAIGLPRLRMLARIAERTGVTPEDL